MICFSYGFHIILEGKKKEKWKIDKLIIGSTLQKVNMKYIKLLYNFCQSIWKFINTKWFLTDFWTTIDLKMLWKLCPQKS